MAGFGIVHIAGSDIDNDSSYKYDCDEKIERNKDLSESSGCLCVKINGPKQIHLLCLKGEEGGICANFKIICGYCEELKGGRQNMVEALA